MTDNVINFPTGSVRHWAEIERSIRNEFSESSPVSDSVADRIVGQMKALFDTLDQTFTFNVPVDAPVEMADTLRAAIEAGVQSSFNLFAQSLYIERLHREIDVCKELGLWW